MTSPNRENIMTNSPPFFLIGVARSGTTLLSLMLDTHSQLAIPYESHFIIPYFKDRQRVGDLSHKPQRVALVTSILAEPAVSHWAPRITIEDLDVDQCTSLSATVQQLFSAYAR